MAKYVLKENKIVKVDESYSMAEKANIIRTLLKTEYKLTSNDVSVRKDGSAIHVDIKSLNAIKHYFDIKKISDSQRNIDRDERTHEILSGGNTFVFVQIAVPDEVNKIVAKEIEKVAPAGWLEDPNPKNESIILFGVDSIWVSKEGGKYTIKGQYGMTSNYKNIGSQWIHTYIRDSEWNIKDQTEFKKTISKIFK